jgi:hypothetical protein
MRCFPRELRWRSLKCRLAQAWGYEFTRAPHLLAKTDQTIQKRFDRLIEKIDLEDGCGLEEATRRARLEAPNLAKALALLT